LSAGFDGQSNGGEFDVYTWNIYGAFVGNKKQWPAVGDGRALDGDERARIGKALAQQIAANNTKAIIGLQEDWQSKWDCWGTFYTRKYVSGMTDDSWDIALDENLRTKWMSLPGDTRELCLAIRTAHQLQLRLQYPGGDPGDDHDAVVDLKRMTEVMAFDEISRVVHTQAGVRLGELERAVGARGLTLGLASFEEDEAVGTWLARGAPGGPAPEDDRVSQLLCGLEAVLPDGQEFKVAPVPRRAVGPDLLHSFIGTRGRLGIIAGCHLVLKRQVSTTELAFRFATPEAAESARAWMRGRGVRSLTTRICEDGVLLVEIGGPEALRAGSESVARQTAVERAGVEIGPSEAYGLPAQPIDVGNNPITNALSRMLRN